MAESTHSIYKTEFLRRKHSVDAEQHLKDLEAFFIYYNEKRYPFDFFGLTPLEVLAGQKPNKKRFRKQIEYRKKQRIAENREFNNCPLICI
jgi:hypothetical protein